MNNGSVRPINVCDRDCALANGCVVGGRRCAKCGLWFCASELDEDGVCDNCHEEQEENEEEE